MKKTLFSLLLLAGINALAIKPSEWLIIRKDYVYINGNKQAISPLKDIKLLDINVTPDNKLWILTDKSLYAVKDLKSEISLEEPLETGKIPYQSSNTRPRICTESKSRGLYLMASSGLWLTEDYKGWQNQGVRPEGDINGSDFTEMTDLTSTPTGSVYMSGLKDKTPGVGCYYPDEGWIYSYISKDQADAAEQKTTFKFIDLQIDKNHVVWMRGGQGNTGLWKLVNNKIWFVPGITAIDIATNNEGNLYVATPTGVYTIDKENNKTKIIDIAVTYLTFDKSDILWYAPTQANTLVRCNLKTDYFFQLTTKNSPVEGRISKIVVDEKNTKYIMTVEPEGIYIINDSKSSYKNWTVYSPIFDSPEVMADNYWKTMFTDQDGGYVSLINQDKKFRVLTFQNEQWTQTDIYDGPTQFHPDMYLLNDATEAFGKVLLGTNRGLYRLENKKFELVEDFDKKQLSNNIKALLKDDEGNLWIGSSDGLAKYDGKNYTYFNKKNTPALTDESILSLCVAPNKNIFIGTGNGVAVIDKGVWTFYDKKNGLDSKKVAAVVSNSKGQTFVASVSLLTVTNKMSIYENGQITTEDIPEKIIVNKMLVDNYDNLWICGINGLACRKANGEYVIFNTKNSPLVPGSTIAGMFLFGDELRIILKKEWAPTGTPTATTQSITIPDKTQLSTFLYPEQVLVYSTKNMLE